MPARNRKKYVFRFPPRLVGRPIASELVSDYGLVVNILRARVEPDEEGMLVVELTGPPGSIKPALEHARAVGVEIEPLEKDITFHRELCVDCTACRSLCPSGALSAKEPEMTVEFDGEKCIACEICVVVCPYGAVETQF